MFLLDTNIISEMMKKSPSNQVISWVNQHASATLFISSITIAEIGYGLAALPPGQRREELENAFNRTIMEGFENRIRSFDEDAAHAYGQIMSTRKQGGRPMSILDGQIAAIAYTSKLTLVTRNTRDFIDCELDLIDPFRV